MIIINSETAQNKHSQLILMDSVPSSSHYTVLCQQMKVYIHVQSKGRQVPPQAPLKAYVCAKWRQTSSETKIACGVYKACLHVSSLVTYTLL